MTEPKAIPAHRARPSGRDAKRAARAARAVASIPYITRALPCYEVLNEDGLALIERNADTILAEIGIKFLGDPEAIDIWRKAGAEVHDELVRFPRGMCRELVQKTAPREFVQQARNSARSVRIGGPNTVFAPAHGPPLIHQLDRGRRHARIQDFPHLLKLPYIPAGAMSPVTVAGTAAQTLAEALAGMAFTQLLNPGAPIVFGSFASSISMQSGAPTFGTPEPALVLYIMAALARRLRVPFRSGGGLCASQLPDAPAAVESAQTLVATCLAGVNFVLHTAGWLEGGLAMGYEKFVMDADQAGMMHTLLAGVDLSENGQALEAIREVGPGKHFLGCAHTQANFENAFYRSPLADNNSFEQWQAEGSKDMATRANALWKKQLAEYEAPPLDVAVDEALCGYIARRKAAFPDSTV